MENPVISRIEALREQMLKRGIGIYIVPTSDFHESEYVGEYFKCRSYLTGFTGSAGTAVVTKTEAGLWTDGKRTMTWLNENEYLVFRTRTTVKDGKLNYAHYGCIQGQWSPDSDSMVLEDGCFNPTPNDASIEDGFYLRNTVRGYAERQ